MKTHHMKIRNSFLKKKRPEGNKDVVQNTEVYRHMLYSTMIVETNNINPHKSVIVIACLFGIYFPALTRPQGQCHVVMAALIRNALKFNNASK